MNNICNSTINRHFNGIFASAKMCFALCFYCFVQVLCVDTVYAKEADEFFVTADQCKISPFDDKVTKKAALIFKMSTIKHASGAVYAIRFELLNNTNKKISIMVDHNIIKSILVVILVEKYKNKYIAEPKIEIDTKKEVKDKIVIDSGKSWEWYIYLKDILKTTDSVKRELKNNIEGLFMIYFYFDYSLIYSGCEKEYKQGKISLMKDDIVSLDSYIAKSK